MHHASGLRSDRQIAPIDSTLGVTYYTNEPQCEFTTMVAIDANNYHYQNDTLRRIDVRIGALTSQVSAQGASSCARIDALASGVSDLSAKVMAQGASIDAIYSLDESEVDNVATCPQRNWPAEFKRGESQSDWTCIILLSQHTKARCRTECISYGNANNVETTEDGTRPMTE
ncbi:uncharacterized protein HD556DRAFT_133150 [Suillus plorans]|uniref:Uncharacterized protein n=1 Tax=Suillus plorans TaxID=116603 RepID=A0A9P7AAC6_9AGAM|nr:uncharacterized protein HD556DRAFT_133150 [Suillus plorans]KAG1785434.1 hypothetical protein HD556DRAFT_133150 [Suillus plorans]